MAAKKIRVLLAERRPAQRERTRAMLERAVCVEIVDVVDTGPAALHVVDRHRVDLVLVDLLMPGMSGLETTFRLKRLRVPPAVGLLTLGAGQVYELAAQEVRAEGLIRKDRLGPDLYRLLCRLYPAARPGLGALLGSESATAPTQAGAAGEVFPASRPGGPSEPEQPTEVRPGVVHRPNADASTSSWIGLAR